MTTLVRCCVCSFIIFTYWCSTVPAQVVEIPDPNLEEAIREELELPDGIPLTQQEMLRLTTLEARNRQIADLTGLEYAINLIGVTFPYNEISDLTRLARLMRLEYLWLWGNPISDLSPLTNLTALKRIDLAGCQISDINPLVNLTQLTYINLRGNRIVDINALTNLQQLTKLRLDSNRIVDISPLANLNLLEHLEIRNNSIADVQPLANLENLMDLKIAGNPIRDFSPLFGLNLKNVDIDIHRLQELLDIEVEILDPALDQSIRAKLMLADDVPITKADMERLTNLRAGDGNIASLEGLEHAINLKHLNVAGNKISDLTPLSDLTKLSTFYAYGTLISDLTPLVKLINLKSMDLAGCDIVDVRPLANLTKLESLNIRFNDIVDINPLTGLTNLTRLWLDNNQIVDISPLTNLTNLVQLSLERNYISDHNPIQGLNIVELTYDQVCELPSIPVRPRIKGRTFPSAFSAWGGIGWSPVLNRSDLTDEQQLALHDFYWTPSFRLRMRDTKDGFRLMGLIDEAVEQRDRWLDINPNMVFIRGIFMREGTPGRTFPADSPYWLRDSNGNLMHDLSAEANTGGYLINFTLPEVQDIIVGHALAAARCGYDGVMFDWWREDKYVLSNRDVNWQPVLLGGNAAEQQARDNILRRIRAATDPEFLIIVNGNRRKTPRGAPDINGLFMETLRDNDAGYTVEGLIEIEDTLLWAEQNLRQPQINCLEGWGIPTQQADSPDNLRWMRVFTTMSLTHSDGYVLYNTGAQGTHDHYWYDFWDADLGKPIGPKAQQYQNVEGLFIREFTNGWTVYNRSGTAQTITLPSSATPVSDRGGNAASYTHLLPDLDGEIYLTPRSFADVNDDGRVNVLDLVQVANGLGKATPDPNGDGVVNILDLVFVAQQFSQ